jgi:hypothetical protein
VALVLRRPTSGSIERGCAALALLGLACAAAAICGAGLLSTPNTKVASAELLLLSPSGHFVQVEQASAITELIRRAADS